MSGTDDRADGRDLLARWALSEIRGDRWGPGFRQHYAMPPHFLDPAVAFEAMGQADHEALAAILGDARRGLFEHYGLPIPEGPFRRVGLDVPTLGAATLASGNQPWSDYVAQHRERVRPEPDPQEAAAPLPLAVRPARKRKLVLLDGHRRIAAAWLRSERGDPGVTVEIMVPATWKPPART